MDGKLLRRRSWTKDRGTRVMARHDFVCSNAKCDHIQMDAICSGADESTYPRHCGKPMEINWMSLPNSVQAFEPFTTRNIHPDGKPLLVRNKGDLQRYYKQYGVVHYDDPNLVAEGNEIRRKGSWNPSAFIDMGGKR